MSKVLLGTILGVFVGAVLVEVLNRTNPGLTKRVEERAKRTVSGFVDAFKEGYQQAEKA
jgi:hypothetical protein